VLPTATGNGTDAEAPAGAAADVLDVALPRVAAPVAALAAEPPGDLLAALLQPARASPAASGGRRRGDGQFRGG
jgi:hypothetical protein